MFLSHDHEERFNELLERDNTRLKDNERQALFFVLSGNEDLFRKIDNFYDFEDHSIRPEGFNEVDLTSSTKALVELAFNLYNNYSHVESEMKSVLDLFASLDENNFELALMAIRVRFNQIVMD
jgi:hypothetical protein